MKSIEEFLSDLKRRQTSCSGALTSQQHNRRPVLPQAVRQAANRRWQIFPVYPLAKLNGNRDLLIGEATSDISRLEELAAEYPLCGWGVAVGPSSLCILEVSGAQGSDSLAALSREEGECLTLQARRGDTAWAFFRYPKGLVLRDSAKKLAAGLRMLGRGDSCALPPSGGSVYINPWAEVETVPTWLRELAFETPDTPPANTVPVPACPSRPVPCRPNTHFEKPHRGTRKGYPVFGQAGWRGGYRISRQR